MPTLEETILAFIGDMERSKTSDPDIVFTEKNGVTGTVSMGYIYSMPFRTNPEKKQLVIKRITVNGKSVVTPTLQKISRETPLTEIKIESIQNAEWIPMLQRKGWSIETDDGGIHHAVIKKGGRKSKRSRRSKKSRRS
jgi:hypothetical protein